ncbi:hypothetical protein QL285_021874 [Trifolium repens]|nr:hypothetical protein QL285_021874 [Trifolium repens]
MADSSGAKDDENVMHKLISFRHGDTQRYLWGHPDSVKLFNMFPTVLVMDSTYKVNKYRIPLLEVVGCTSTGKTYAIAFGFLTSEKEDNFVCALQAVSNLLRCKDELKKAKLGKKVRSREVWPNVKAAWENIVDSASKEEYNSSVNTFKERYGHWLEFIECLLWSTMGLSCTCSLAKTVREGELIRLVDIHVNWRRLQFDIAHFEADKDANLLLVPDWDVLQAKFKSADHDMKVHMKEMFRQLVNIGTTSMCPPHNQVKWKGAPKGWSKRPRYSQEERSTKRSPSLVEHVELQSQC